MTDLETAQAQIAFLSIFRPQSLKLVFCGPAFEVAGWIVSPATESIQLLLSNLLKRYGAVELKDIPYTPIQNGFRKLLRPEYQELMEAEILSKEMADL